MGRRTTEGYEITLHDRVLTGRIQLGLSHGSNTIKPSECASVGEALRDTVRDAVCVRADNVSGFWNELVEHSYSDAGPLDITRVDMPNLFGPWDRWWFEWEELDSYSRSHGFTKSAVMGQSSLDRETGWWRHELIAFIGSPKTQGLFTDGVCYTADVKPDGILDSIQAANVPWVVNSSGASERAMHPNIPPALLTLSFLNCGNVQVSWLDPPEGLNRATKKRSPHRVALTPYAIIDIRAATKLVPEESGPKREGWSRVGAAFREIRGHFKRYQGKGLFGKHKGTFFFSAHQSGSGERVTRQAGYRLHAGTYETGGNSR
jgi:hypothetical protein